MREEFVIVGGSYAAGEIAGAARQNGYDGNIRIITAEDELPYHRPPLSKAFLLEAADENGLPLKAAQFYRERNIDVDFATRGISVDSRASTLDLSDGRSLRFDWLALAVGARARTLNIPGSDLAGIHYLRSLTDARALKRAAADANQVVVIGGGFIGLEVASVLAQRGKNVTVLESQDHLLTRVVAPPISAFLTAAHEAHGVTIMNRAQVVAITGDQDRARHVVLHDGRTLDADLIVIGIGSIPNIELAVSAGLSCADGIIVDRYGLTSHPRILSAGDCAFYDGPYTKGGMRLESVQNAMDQARSAGATLAGVRKAYDSIPWFWSDQYKFKLQIAGLSKGYDSYVERPGAEGELSVFYFKDELCIAVDSINRPRDHMSARKVLPLSVSRETLANVEFNIAALMTGASARNTTRG